MAILVKGTDFESGDQVTATNLDAHVDNATFASGAVDASTTEIAGGSIIVKDGGITPSKLSTGHPTWDTNGNLTIIGDVTIPFTQSGTGAVESDVDTKLKESVSVRDFGAVGDGVTDDTAAINLALAVGGSIDFPDGDTYLISTTTSGSDDPVLTLISNTTINCGSGVSFVLDTTTSERYKIFQIKDISNVIFKGNQCTITGDRTNPTGGVLNHGHGINIEGSSNVFIDDLLVQDCWGDGLYVGAGAAGFSSNVYFNKVHSYNCRRQAFSLVSAKGFASHDCLYEKANGTAPSCGVDIEPDGTTEFLENIRFYGDRAKDCDGTGFFVYLDAWRNNERQADIQFIGCRTQGCNADGGSVNGQYAAFEARRVRDTGGALIPEGTIKFIDCVSVDDTYSGFAVSDKSSLGPRVQFIRPVTINPNQVAATSPILASGVRVYASGTTYTTSLGGVDIIDPEVIDRDGNLDNAALAAFNLSDAAGAPATDVFVYNPRITLSAASAGRNFQANNNGGVWYFQDSNPPEEAFATSNAILNRHVGSVLTNETQVGGTAVMTLGTNAQMAIGSEVEFLVKAAQTFRVIPNASEEILPSGNGLGKYMEAAVIGNSVRLRRISSTEWVIASIIGTWTFEA
jgi:hypothetical protein